MQNEFNQNELISNDKTVEIKQEGLANDDSKTIKPLYNKRKRFPNNNESEQTLESDDKNDEEKNEQTVKINMVNNGNLKKTRSYSKNNPEVNHESDLTKEDSESSLIDIKKNLHIIIEFQSFFCLKV